MFDNIINFGKKKNSSELIEGAVSMFTTALSDLNAGIQEGEEEIAAKEAKLEEKRVEFKEAETKTSNSIAIINADIERAGKISANIGALLN